MIYQMTAREWIEANPPATMSREYIYYSDEGYFYYCVRQLYPDCQQDYTHYLPVLDSDPVEKLWFWVGVMACDQNDATHHHGISALDSGSFEDVSCSHGI